MEKSFQAATILELFALILGSALLTMLITLLRQHFIYKFNCELNLPLCRKTA